MGRSTPGMTLGLPRMRKEAGERRDFLPSLVRTVTDLGARVFVESGIGSGMGYEDRHYLDVSPLVRVVGNREAYGQDVVLTLRAPEGEFEKVRPGAALISMLHFATRPHRVQRLAELGIEAISLDSIADDQGRRLVENLRSVAWNGIEAAFDALERTYPALADPARAPVVATVLGAGGVGRHAVEAATKYGRPERADTFAARGLRGVEVVTCGRNLTGDEEYMRRRLQSTDVLVDATQRHDPSVPIVPNDWIDCLPEHAVICDLVVDPYLLHESPPTVRGIEGIPQGNLDRYVFGPDDPAWDQVPLEVPNRNRRTVASCYSWPGVHPLACMELYGSQLASCLTTLFRHGGVDGLDPSGEYLERALYRATLRAWLAQQTPLAGAPA